MRAHMLSLLMSSEPPRTVAPAFDGDAHAWQREQDDHLAIGPAVAAHVNRHYLADPAGETTSIKRLEIGRKGQVRTFRAIAHFQGHRMQGDVTVVGTYDPATRALHVKRLEAPSRARRGDAGTSMWAVAEQMLHKTFLFLHP